MVTLYATAGISVGLAGVILAAMTLLKKSGEIYYHWAGFWVAISFWGFGVAAIGLSETAETALLAWKITGAGVPFIPIQFTLISLALLRQNNRLFMFSLYVTGVILALFSFFEGVMIAGVRQAVGSVYIFIPGFFFIFFVVFYMGLVLLSLFKLWRAYNTLSGNRRIRATYFFMGGLVAFTGGGFNFLTAYGFDAVNPAFANFTVYIGSVILSYAILRLRLKGIRYFIRDTFFYLLLALIFWISFAVLYVFFGEFDLELLSATGLTLAFLVTVTSAWLLPRVTDKLRVLLHKGITASDYRLRKAFEELTDKLPNILNLEELVRQIKRTISRHMGVAEDKVRLIGMNGEHNHLEDKEVDANMPTLISWMKRENLAAVREEFRTQLETERQTKSEQEVKNMLMEMGEAGVELAYPLVTRNQLRGMLLLGGKKDDETYTEDDLALIQSISASAAAAFENARLYRESERFGERLQEEVRKATKELQEANKELKMLDKAKNEFIRLASHQLYTPLTAARGYVSMMLEGEYGEVSEKSQSVLKVVNRSTERLVSLVKNLLDITKIEAGHFRLTLEELRLEEIVRDVIEELKHSAEEKGLVLNLKIEENLNMLIGDKRRLRQAVSNLVDNGVKYTEKGTVTVELRQQDDNLQLLVNDTGRGLAPDEMEKLFQKFSRLPDAPLIHTEGVGLGLFIVQQIAREHNGMVRVESAGKGKGSTFTLVIPSAASEHTLKIGDEVGVVG